MESSKFSNNRIKICQLFFTRPRSRLFVRCYVTAASNSAKPVLRLSLAEAQSFRRSWYSQAKRLEHLGNK